MTIPYATSGQLGVNLATVYPAQSTSLYPYTQTIPFALGQQITATDNSVWTFVQFGTGGVTGLGYVVTFDQAFAAVMLSTDNDIYGKKVGVAPAAAVATDYGWVQVYGTCDDIRCEQDALANAALGPTADAGQVDDAAATGLFIKGMTLTTARGGTDGNAPGILNYPVIDTVYEPET
jgi:hypothetical protein